MTLVSRRTFVAGSAAGAALTGTAALARRNTPAGLQSLTTAAQPISAQEYEARLQKLQTLMQARRTAALLVEAGSALEYFQPLGS